ncbi:MAG: hypothetical protein ACLTKY_05710 [Oscillospiraceae bacterium]
MAKSPKGLFDKLKGNRQGVLSRLITRRSGKIAKQYYKKVLQF